MTAPLPQPFDGTVFRAILAAADPLSPAQAADGRFHHAGQWAIYTSLTAEGCLVAIRRYLRAGDPPRLLVPLRIRADRVADLRGRPEVSAVWQDIRAGGAEAPTWAFSDAARQAGMQGLLYSSRSRPDLTHLAVFDPPVIRATGEAMPFPAQE